MYGYRDEEEELPGNNEQTAPTDSPGSLTLRLGLGQGHTSFSSLQDLLLPLSIHILSRRGTVRVRVRLIAVVGWLVLVYSLLLGQFLKEVWMGLVVLHTIDTNHPMLTGECFFEVCKLNILMSDLTTTNQIIAGWTAIMQL